MSTRNNASIKTFNNNKSFNKCYNGNNKHHYSNVKPVPTVSKNNCQQPQQAYQKKKNNHRYQQPQQDEKLQATTAKNCRRRNNRKKNFDSMTTASSEDNTSTSSTSSSEEEDGPLTPPATPTHLLDTNHTVKNAHYQNPLKSLGDQVYAGPTFNNAPAPSAIPIPPTFGNASSPRGSPTHNIMTSAPGRPMLNYSPSASPSPPSLAAATAAPAPFGYPQQQHQYLPYSPSLSHHHQHPQYPMMHTPPQHKVITAFELEQTNLALSEIQRDLRSMLRIQS